MRMNKKESVELSRKHAIAVLMDKGLILETATVSRIPSATLLAMLGVTYEGGAAITKSAEEKALLHWHSTGFLIYVGNPNYRSDKQRSADDDRLIKSAVAETMQNRKQRKKFTTLGTRAAHINARSAS